MLQSEELHKCQLFLFQEVASFMASLRSVGAQSPALTQSIQHLLETCLLTQMENLLDGRCSPKEQACRAQIASELAQIFIEALPREESHGQSS
jgi:hypothetical protein